MAKIRLDKVNDKKVVSVKVKKDLPDGAFGAIKAVLGEDLLGREVYELAELAGTEAKGRIVMVAMDVHRYEDYGYNDLYHAGKARILEAGFDKKCFEGDIVRAYILDAGDIISTDDAKLVALNKGDMLAPKATSNELEKTVDESKAVAMVIAKEKWCGVDVAVLQFL